MLINITTDAELEHFENLVKQIKWQLQILKIDRVKIGEIIEKELRDRLYNLLWQIRTYKNDYQIKTAEIHEQIY